MENKHQKAIANLYRNQDLPPIVVLDILDDYQYMAQELVIMIEESTEDILSGWE